MLSAGVVLPDARQIPPLFPPQLCHKGKKKQKKRLCLCEPEPCVGAMSPVGTVPISDLLPTGKGQACRTPAPCRLPARDAKRGRVLGLRAERCGAEGKLQPPSPHNGPSTSARPSSPAPGGANAGSRAGHSQPRSTAPGVMRRSDVKAVQALTS